MMRTNNAQVRVIKYTIFNYLYFLCTMYVCIKSEMKIYFQRDQDSIMQKDSCQRKCICQYLTYQTISFLPRGLSTCIEVPIYLHNQNDVYISFYPSIFLSIHDSIYLYILSLYTSVFISFYQSTNLDR